MPTDEPCEGAVGKDIIEETPEIWGKDYSTESSTVERDYDTFADTGTYDETFDDWGYVGPETAAAIARNYVPIESRILDAACGSGLTGTALRNLGYENIEGIDISSRLLELAMAYRLPQRRPRAGPTGATQPQMATVLAHDRPPPKPSSRMASPSATRPSKGSPSMCSTPTVSRWTSTATRAAPCSRTTGSAS